MSDYTNQPGSMADVPKDLLEQIKELEKVFTVDAAKLKEITNHFVGELEKGLCFTTGIMVPHGIVLILSRSECRRRYNCLKSASSCDSRLC